MTKIICDQFGLHPICHDDFIVEEDIHYETALNRLKISADESQSNIIVRNPALFHWFDAPARQFGCPIVKLDPLVEFSKFFSHTTIPIPLNQHPEWIVELGLLEKAEHEGIIPNESISIWLKRVLLGPVWKSGELISDNDMADLFNWFTTHDEKGMHPLTRRLLYDQIESWGKRYPERADLFLWLGSAPFQRGRFILWEQAVHLYPANRIAEWLQHDDIWYTLNLLPGRKQCLPIMNVQIKLPEAISAFIRTFLEGEWDRSPLDALSFMAGRLDVEKGVLIQKLQSSLHQGIALEREVFEKISQFNELPEAIALARQLVPIQNPSFISETASVDTYQEWIRDEYLPFYRSCALLKRLEFTSPYVKAFERWMEKNYPGLLINGTGMAYRQIYQIKSRLADGPILLYVFDGLDYLSAQNELLPALELSGAYPEADVVPYLTFLPTETFVAKPTLVCGLMDSQILPEQPNASFYRELLKNLLGLAENEIRSATDKDATLDELVQEKAKAYLFLDNHLDREYLHSGLTPYVRINKYSAYLKKQAGAIVEAAKLIKERYNNNLHVSVCSDHGYTEFPQNTPIIKLQPAKGMKTRSIPSADVILAVDGTESDIWWLKKGIYGLKEEMAIPIGYGCLGKRPKGASHGGCTPQEVAVPWLSLTFQKPEPAKMPIVTIEGVIFRRRRENQLMVTISNLNNYPISIVEVAIDGLEIATSFPVRITQQQIGRISASYNATTANETMLEFKGSCTFTHRHGKEKIMLLSKVETKGAMVNDFDDEFEV